MELRIYIKQSAQFDTIGNPVYYQGSTVNTLSQTAGTLPFARQWPSYTNFIDVTEEITSDLFKINLTWTAQADNEGFITPNVTQQQKGFSGSITVGGTAYQLIKKWLIEDVSAVFNSVDVMIKHFEHGKECGQYYNYIVKSTDIEFCEGLECEFDLNLRQKDEAYSCIRSTIIADNWQGWFQSEPANGKKHPRFSYCNEIRPNGMLILQWYLMANVAFMISSIILPILGALNSIIFAINGVIKTINLVISFINDLGGNITELREIKYFDTKTFKDGIANFFVESAGCGREHPAPLIRDYIYNVCAKCGVRVDGETVPLFFNPQLEIDPSEPDRGDGSVSNPHYNACYLYPGTKRGVRRFIQLTIFGYSEPDTTTFYQANNAPQHTLDTFLDELKQLYNAEWLIKDNTLYFFRKDRFRAIQQDYVLDLSNNGADRGSIVEGICYEWNENKIAAFTEGLYTIDPTDTCGNQAMGFMNDIYEYGDASKVKIFEGKEDKTTRYSATKFRGDGVDNDYIMDAFQIVVNGSWMSVFIGVIMFDIVKPVLQLYADYALLLKDEQTSLAKVLCWDGVSYLNAKAVRYYAGIDTFGGEPEVNHYYNPRKYGTPTGWSTVHIPQTFVRGSSLTFAGHPVGMYRAADTLNIFNYDMPALLVNYPMYMAVGYRDSLWDWFHWIDDPNRRGASIRNFSVKLELCCDMLNKLQVFGDGNSIVLGEKVSLPYGREGVITEIIVSYDNEDTFGKCVEIKGKVYG